METLQVKIQKAIEIQLKRTMESDNTADQAMKYSQAVLNLMNALRCSADMENS